MQNERAETFADYRCWTDYCDTADITDGGGNFHILFGLHRFCKRADFEISLLDFRNPFDFRWRIFVV